MGRYAQFVIGPAGSGKSTYCFTMQNYMAGNSYRLPALVVNLDPGQERTEEMEEKHPFDVDVRDLISVTDVIEELEFGPNGALVFCMEHLEKNLDWLKERLDEVGSSDDEYFIFDCPGQIELYTHIPVLRTIVEKLASWNIHVCVVHVVDALFIDDPAKYISGSLLALTSMMQLQSPAVNVITKCDIKKKTFGGGRKRRPRLVIPGMNSTNVTDDLDTLEQQEMVDKLYNCHIDDDDDAENNESLFLNVDDPEYFNPDPLSLRQSILEANLANPFKKLSESICDLLETYNLVSFLPLDVTSEDSLEYVLSHIDGATQYGEDLEPRDPGDINQDEEEEN